MEAWKHLHKFLNLTFSPHERKTTNTYLAHQMQYCNNNSIPAIYLSSRAAFLIFNMYSERLQSRFYRNIPRILRIHLRLYPGYIRQPLCEFRSLFPDLLKFYRAFMKVGNNYQAHPCEGSLPKETLRFANRRFI